MDRCCASKNMARIRVVPSGLNPDSIPGNHGLAPMATTFRRVATDAARRVCMIHVSAFMATLCRRVAADGDCGCLVAGFIG